MKRSFLFAACCFLILLSSCHNKERSTNTAKEVSVIESTEATSDVSEDFTTRFEGESSVASTMQQQVSLVATVRATQNQNNKKIDTTSKKEENKTETPTRKWPKTFEPDVERSAELIYQRLSKIEFNEPFSERNAAVIADRFASLEVPEIVEVNVVESELTKGLETKYYGCNVQFIDVNGQDYYISLSNKADFLWIEKGAGENRETIYFKDSGRPDGWQP